MLLFASCVVPKEVYYTENGWKQVGHTLLDFLFIPSDPKNNILNSQFPLLFPVCYTIFSC